MPALVVACLGVSVEMASMSGGEEVTVMSYNIRTASSWATRDGGDARFGRTWARRKASVAKTVEIGKAWVVGTQEGLGWQVEEMLPFLPIGVRFSQWELAYSPKLHGTLVGLSS